MNNIKKILKAHMALEGVTQEDMANLLGIKRQTFNTKINGHIAFSDKEKILIAELFKTDVAAIFFNTKVDIVSSKAVI